MKRGHVQMTREQVARTEHLVNTIYRPSEIAEEIGCDTDTVYRSFIPAGCPHTKDKQRHIWIVGDEFKAWVRSTFKPKDSAKMPEGFAYCLRCRQPVRMVSPVEKQVARNRALLMGKCETCGAKVNRAKKRGEHGKP